MSANLSRWSLLILVTLTICPQVKSYAEDGVESIIQQDQSDELGGHETINVPPGSGSNGDDFSEFNDQPDAGQFDAGQTVGINLSINRMKAAISAQIGEPDANALVLILFSLAALLQMARTIAGQGNWVAFIVRVIVVVAFLRAFNSLFNGVEAYVTYLSGQILGGQSAFDILWSSQDTIFSKLSAVWNASSSQDLWSQFTAIFSQDTLFSLFVVLTYVFMFAVYALIYIVQACILISLQYFGPLIIALALIPETDFTSGYIASVLKVLFWTVITAFLIKIMSTTMQLNFFSPLALSYSELVAIMAMNICFGFAFFCIPVISEMIFSGKGWSTLGMAVTGFGARMASLAAGHVGDKLQDRYDRAKGYAKTKAGDAKDWAMNKAGDAARYGAHKSVGFFKGLTPTARREAVKAKHPNGGYGPKADGGNAITIAKDLNRRRKQEA